MLRVNRTPGYVTHSPAPGSVVQLGRRERPAQLTAQDAVGRGVARGRGVLAVGDRIVQGGQQLFVLGWGDRLGRRRAPGQLHPVPGLERGPGAVGRRVVAPVLPALARLEDPAPVAAGRAAGGGAPVKCLAVWPAMSG